MPEGALLNCASAAVSGFHRVKELDLEEKQRQLDHELRAYMNLEGL